MLSLVLQDQRKRWRRGERVLVEQYLQREQALGGDHDTVLDLVYNEVLLRRENGERVALEEYLKRFNHLEEPLRMLFEVDRSLETPARPRAKASSPAASSSRAALTPPPPPDVPGYETIKVLGQGGMGVVWQARDTGLGRLVALKFLHPERHQDREAVERFRREARTASALNHPHICTIYQLGESSGRCFIAMEFVEGQTLRELAEQRPAPETLAGLLTQAARALAAAHAAGIVHRDIKPENILVRPDGYVKVLDFGLARLLPAGLLRDLAGDDPDTDPGALIGTVAYMSPEQARGEAAGAASDLFSLGIVAYELAVGSHPFEVPSGLGTLHAIATAPPIAPRRINPEVPPALEALILQMLEKDARRRPTAAEAAAVFRRVARSSASLPAGPAPVPTRRHTVGRERERKALREAFNGVEAGRGLLLCLTGEPGIGKTTLVEEFLDELAAGGHAEGVGRGRCSERLAGAGVYLPVLEALDELLQGESGTTVARRLRELAPTWHAQVAPTRSDDSATRRPVPQPQISSQERMKREFLAFTQEMARLRPLVLCFDDLHWADPSTVDLLAYLGSRSAAMRLLIVATYRRTEMLAGRHAFVPVQLELQHHGVCREVPLSFLNRIGIASYLELAFPGHQFPDDLPARLHTQTGGNPLFLVELLNHLRDRRVIMQTDGAWALTCAIPDFQRELPLSVRSLIQRKLDLLDETDRRVLAAASVQGYEFDAAVAARVVAREAADVEEQLAVLDRVHGLVRLVRERELPDGTLTVRYQFVHVLYQNALYASLQPARRAAWSAATAAALLEYHGEHSSGVAGELALLFETARDFPQAAEHFLLAAQNAAEIYAHQEAVELARRGLELLRQTPDTPERDRCELRLLVALAMQLQVTQGFAAAAAEPAYTRARELCHRLPEHGPLYAVLWGLWLFHKVRSELHKAKALADLLFTQAEQVDNTSHVLQSHQALAVTSLCLGEPAVTRGHMEQGVKLYDRKRHRGHTFVYGQDPGVACQAFGSVALWLLGHPDQAVQKSRDAVALAGELGQPSTLALAFHFAAMLRQYRREAEAVQVNAEAAMAIADEHGFSFWLAGGKVMRGWALAEQGKRADGIALMRQGLAEWAATGSQTYRTYYLALLAQQLGQQGDIEEGLSTLYDSLALVQHTGERFHEAELHRLRGELLLASRADAEAEKREAEAAFHQARDVARQQGARSLELRAVMSLSRLCQLHGHQAQARPLLTEAYDCFIEGHETQDLRDARELIDQLR